jgi:hypothetical protein
MAIMIIISDKIFSLLFAVDISSNQQVTSTAQQQHVLDTNAGKQLS